MKETIRKIAALGFLLGISILVQAQQKKDQPVPGGKNVNIDSIAFHLYTDSLKKGVHNYISVDGHTGGGGWLPLTDKEIQFSSNAGHFEGNSLVLPPDFSGEKVSITATYKRNNRLSRTVIIYVKKLPDNEKLKSKEEILGEIRQQGGRKRKSRN